MGYPSETKGYNFYNPTENKVFVARTTVYLEERIYFLRKIVGGTIDLDKDREPQDHIEPEMERDQDVYQNVNSNPVQETQVVRRSGRIRYMSPRNIMDFS